MMFPDELPYLWSHGSPIKSHHKQLALRKLAMSTLHGDMLRRRLYQSPIHRTLATSHMDSPWRRISSSNLSKSSHTGSSFKSFPTILPVQRTRSKRIRTG